MAETPTIEVAPVWICRGENCGLRVRNVDGRPIPEPKKWEDGLCVPCRVEVERVTNGQGAANELHDRLHGIRKRPKPFGHRDPDLEDGEEPQEPKEPKPKRKPRNDLTPQQREQVETELENTFDTDRIIAERVGVSVGRAREVRDRMGLPGAPERRVRARQCKVEQFLLADPDRLNWSSEAVAEAIGEEASKVTGDRITLGLNIGKGYGQPKGTDRPKPKNSHGGQRERQARLARIRAFVRERPNATNREVAEALGLDQRRVQKDRHSLGIALPKGAHGRPLTESEMAKSAT